MSPQPSTPTRSEHSKSDSYECSYDCSGDNHERRRPQKAALFGSLPSSTSAYRFFELSSAGEGVSVTELEAFSVRPPSCSCARPLGVTKR